jgi:hypothetical protein
VGWLLSSENRGLECLFVLSLGEEVGGALLNRLLMSAFNISTSCLIGLQIREGEEAELIASLF